MVHQGRKSDAYVWGSGLRRDEVGTGQASVLLAPAVCARGARAFVFSPRHTTVVRRARRGGRAYARSQNALDAANAHAHGLKPARLISLCVVARADTNRTPHLFPCPGGQRALTESWQRRSRMARG